MKLDLPPAFGAFVKDLVEHGRYAGEADVIRDALRRLADSDLDPGTGEPMNALRAELADAERGPRSSRTVMEVFEGAIGVPAPAK